ncbi:MAG: hypothetical protein KAX44_08520 [Candidatus Brocadiae bacterium]|nr:hypothetical protein [Candidatus Brocadiia bacterium]
MKETLQHIQSVQNLSRRMGQIRSKLDASSARTRVQAKLIEEKQRRADQVHKQRLEATKEADANQLQIDEAEQEIARLKVQLNVIKHQKEYDAIQHAILSNIADIRKCEDQELAALQAIDDLTEEEELLRAEIRQSQSALQETRDESEGQAAELHQRLQKLQEEQQQLRQQINPNVLAAYDRLIPSRHNDAIAPVKNHTCRGCFTRVTKQTENLLMRGEKIVYCHSCGRMLMLPD